MVGFSAFITKLVSSAPPQGIQGLGTPKNISFFNILGDFFGSLFPALWDFISKLIYLIMRFILNIIDFMQFFVKKLCGLDYWGTSDVSPETLYESDIILRFIYNDTIQRVFRYMLGVFVVLLIIFTIVAIAKNEYAYAVGTGKTNDKGAIASRVIKAILLVALMPSMIIFGILASNAILTSLVNAFNINNNLSLGAQIFVSSAYDASKYRKYADTNLRLPITSNVSVTLTDGATSNTGTAKLRTDITVVKPNANDGVFTGFMFKYNDKEYLYYVSVDELVSNVNGIPMYKFYEELLASHMGVTLVDMNTIADAAKINSDLGNYAFTATIGDLEQSHRLIKAAYNTNGFNSVFKIDGIEFDKTYDVGEVEAEAKDYDLSLGNLRTYRNNAFWGGLYDGGVNGIVPIPSEYYVMADVVDYVLSESVPSVYIVNSKSGLIDWTYGSAASGGYVSSKYVKVNSGDLESFVVDYADVGRVLYEPKNKTSEEDGAIFILAYKNPVSNTYVPIVNKKTFVDENGISHRFETDCLNPGYEGIIVARGILDQTYYNQIGYPTLIVESAQTETGNVISSTDAYYSQMSAQELKIKAQNVYSFKNSVGWKSDDFTEIIESGNIEGIFTNNNNDSSQVNDNINDFIETEPSLNGTFVYSNTFNGLAQRTYRYYLHNPDGSVFTDASGRQVLIDVIHDTLHDTFKIKYYDYFDIAVEGVVKKQNVCLTSLTVEDENEGKLLISEDHVDAEYNNVYFYIRENVDESTNEIYYTVDSNDEYSMYLITTDYYNIYSYYQGANAYHYKDATDFKESGLVSANKPSEKVLISKDVIKLGRVTKDDNTGKYIFTATIYYDNGQTSLFTRDSFCDINFMMDANPDGSAPNPLANTDSVKLMFASVHKSVIEGKTYGRIPDYSGISDEVIKSYFSDAVKHYLTFNRYTYSGLTFYIDGRLKISPFIIRLHFDLWGTRMGELEVHKYKLFQGALNLDYNFNTVKGLGVDTFFVAGSLNVLVLIFATFLVMSVLGQAVWGLIDRIFKITLYFLVMPGVVSTLALSDDSKMFSNWKDALIKQVFSAYGVMIGLNFFFLLIPAIRDASQLFSPNDLARLAEGNWLRILPVKALNSLVYLLFMLVALTLITKLPQLISNIVGSEDAYNAGKTVRDDVGNTVKNVGNHVSGRSLMNLKDNVFGNKKTGKKSVFSQYAPGAALWGPALEKIKGDISATRAENKAQRQADIEKYGSAKLARLHRKQDRMHERQAEGKGKQFMWTAWNRKKAYKKFNEENGDKIYTGNSKEERELRAKMQYIEKHPELFAGMDKGDASRKIAGDSRMMKRALREFEDDQYQLRMLARNRFINEKLDSKIERATEIHQQKIDGTYQNIFQKGALAAAHGTAKLYNHVSTGVGRFVKPRIEKIKTAYAEGRVARATRAQQRRERQLDNAQFNEETGIAGLDVGQRYAGLSEMTKAQQKQLAETLATKSAAEGALSAFHEKYSKDAIGSKGLFKMVDGKWQRTGVHMTKAQEKEYERLVSESASAASAHNELQTRIVEENERRFAERRPAIEKKLKYKTQVAALRLEKARRKRLYADLSRENGKQDPDKELVSSLEHAIGASDAEISRLSEGTKLKKAKDAVVKRFEKAKAVAVKGGSKVKAVGSKAGGFIKKQAGEAWGEVKAIGADVKEAGATIGRGAKKVGNFVGTGLYYVTGAFIPIGIYRKHARYKKAKNLLAEDLIGDAVASSRTKTASAARSRRASTRTVTGSSTTGGVSASRLSEAVKTELKKQRGKDTTRTSNSELVRQITNSSEYKRRLQEERKRILAEAKKSAVVDHSAMGRAGELEAKIKTLTAEIRKLKAAATKQERRVSKIEKGSSRTLDRVAKGRRKLSDQSQKPKDTATGPKGPGN